MIPLHLHDFSLPHSLYIHIPFCASKCGYCDFYSISRADPTLQSIVLNKILSEVEDFLKTSSITQFETVYIGGGTPSILKPKLLSNFLHSLSSLWNQNPIEATIEANPESCTEDFFTILNDSFINRISLGIQSMNDAVLFASGRPCDRKKNNAALTLASRYWISKNKRISGDIIAGLPQSTKENTLQSLQEVIEFGLDHISLYMLSIEENTPFAKKSNIEKFLPCIDDVEDVWLSCDEFLHNSKFDRYEISNYSLHGKECLHNERYWNLLPYFGGGPSAVSSLLKKNGGITRLTGLPSIEQFLHTPICYNVEDIDIKTEIFERCMLGFRTKKGLARDFFNSRFPQVSIEKYLSAILQYCTMSDTHISIKPEWYDRLNYVLVKLLDFQDTFSL